MENVKVCGEKNCREKKKCQLSGSERVNFGGNGRTEGKVGGTGGKVIYHAIGLLSLVFVGLLVLEMWRKM